MRLSEELRKRTKAFAAKDIELFMQLPRGREEVRILGKQLLRSGTSVASHAREASRARSDSEFCSKLDVLLQEADESQLWLELLNEKCRVVNDTLLFMLKEVDELIAIFTIIVAKTRKNADES